MLFPQSRLSRRFLAPVFLQEAVLLMQVQDVFRSKHAAVVEQLRLVLMTFSGYC